MTLRSLIVLAIWRPKHDNQQLTMNTLMLVSTTGSPTCWPQSVEGSSNGFQP